MSRRTAPIEMEPGQFRDLGHRLVDQVADFLASLPARPVTPAEAPEAVREALGAGERLPDSGADPGALLDRAAALLFDHSLFNGHPRFFGYITSSAAPIGALGDFLAAAVNPNVGAWRLAPMASEIEAQTVRWIAELIGYPTDCGGLLVSGGNMANFVCFLAARTNKAGGDVRRQGLGARVLRLYVSAETHTWVQKAADLFGLGTDSIRWIPTDKRQRMDLGALRSRIQADLEAGARPFLVVGNGGSVSTGAVDPLPEIAEICREYRLWFHVDGAYGAVAAAVPGVSPDLAGLSMADSVAVDPHKWLYAPVEAGCALVRNAAHLRDTFSYHPPYYHFEEQEAVDYFDLGMQNSRSFRALKVWLALQQAGRDGCLGMIRDDILLAAHFHKLAAAHPELEAFTCNLSIATFRYVPAEMRESAGSEKTEEYLNCLNRDLLTRIERSGEGFVSNAVIEGKFLLRLCIVNFRTSMEDIEALPLLAVRLGREAHAALRGACQ